MEDNVQYSICMCTVCVSFLYNCSGRQLVNERQARKECSVNSLLVPSTYCMVEPATQCMSPYSTDTNSSASGTYNELQWFGYFPVAFNVLQRNEPGGT